MLDGFVRYFAVVEKNILRRRVIGRPKIFLRGTRNVCAGYEDVLNNNDGNVASWTYRKELGAEKATMGNNSVTEAAEILGRQSSDVQVFQVRVLNNCIDRNLSESGIADTNIIIYLYRW